MHRRLAPLAIISTVLLVAACSGTSATPSPAAPSATAAPAASASPEASSAAPASAAATTINWSFWGNNDEAAAMKSLIDGFQKENPSITIEPIWVQGPYEPKLETMIAGGTPPTVMMISTGSMPGFVDAFAPATVDASAYVSPLMTSTMTYNGTVYAKPFIAKPAVMVVNKDLFAKDGVTLPDPKTPMSPADFATMATKLTSGSGDSEVFGAAPLWWGNWLTEFGGSFYSADGKSCTFASPEGIQATNFILDSMYKDKYAPTPDEISGQDPMQWFISGRLATNPNIGPYNLPQLKAIDSFKWMLAPVPGKGAEIEVDGLAISKTATGDQLAAAQKFVDWVSTSDAAQNIIGSSPSAVGVPVIQSAIQGFESQVPDANLAAFVDGLSTSAQRTPVKNDAQIATQFYTGLFGETALGSGNQAPEKVLPELQAQCQAVLGS